MYETYSNSLFPISKFAVAILLYSFELNILSVFSIVCRTCKASANTIINTAAYIVKEAARTTFLIYLNHL